MWKKLFRRKQPELTRRERDPDVVDNGGPIFEFSVKEIYIIVGSPDVFLEAQTLHDLYEARNPKFSRFIDMRTSRTAVNLPPELSLSDIETIVNSTIKMSKKDLGNASVIVQTMSVQFRSQSLSVLLLTYFGASDDPDVIFYEHPNGINFAEKP